MQNGNAAGGLKRIKQGEPVESSVCWALGEGLLAPFVCSQAPLFLSNDTWQSAALNRLTYKRLVLYIPVLQ